MDFSPVILSPILVMYSRCHLDRVPSHISSLITHAGKCDVRADGSRSVIGRGSLGKYQTLPPRTRCTTRGISETRSDWVAFDALMRVWVEYEVELTNLVWDRYHGLS